MTQGICVECTASGRVVGPYPSNKTPYSAGHASAYASAMQPSPTLKPIDDPNSIGRRPTLSTKGSTISSPRSLHTEMAT